MPDTFSVSLVIIGLYYAYKFLKNDSKYNLIFFFIFSTTGMLCKIPALSIFSVLSIVIFIKAVDFHKKVALYLTGALSFSIVCLWYFYWVPFLLETYQYQLYFPKSLAEGLQEIKPLIPELFEKFYFSALHSYIALICFLYGIVLLIKSKQAYFISSLGIISIVFFLFILKTGSVFPLHNYYIIPFTPIMAVLVGYAISSIPLKFQYILFGLISVEAIANQQHDFRIKETQLYKLQLEDITKKVIPKKDLIIINGGQSPQSIYFSNRKGWTVNNTEILNEQYVDSLAKLGAKYIIIDRTTINNHSSKHPVLYRDKNYAIHDLRQ